MESPNSGTASDRTASHSKQGLAVQSHTDVAIIGGGICGLTTALALEQRGISPNVYEATDEYGPVGAGILLQTNAMLVFDELDVAERIKAAGTSLQTGGLRAMDGHYMTKFDLDAVERPEFGYGSVTIKRSTLLDILLEELDLSVRTGKDCCGVAPQTPTVCFDDGTSITPDLVIGADGIDSTVRSAVDPDVTPRSLSGVAYRALVDVKLPEEYHTKGFEVWGTGTYTGGSPVSDDQFYWFATAPIPLTSADAPPHAVEAALRAHLDDPPEPIPALLDALDPSDLVVTTLSDLPPIATWNRGRVVVAGDAAHAMLPFAGQGAAQAIEDSIALADAIATSPDCGRAFAAFEKTRKPRAERVHETSYKLGRLGTMQSRVSCWLRNKAIDSIPDSIVRRFRRKQAAETTLPDTASEDAHPSPS